MSANKKTPDPKRLVFQPFWLRRDASPGAKPEIKSDQ
jgi:hypothetical protein